MKILLLAGGDSSERSVSLDSGKAIYETLKRQNHIVYAIDPSTGKSLLNSDGSFISYNPEVEAGLAISSKKSTWPLAQTLGSPAFQDIEVVVIALHGGSGEDGMLQCLLEVAGKKHTGSDMAASAVAMDKAISKMLCKSAEIDTPEFAVYRLRSRKVDEQLLDEIKGKFQFPVIVKPNDSGSTIGLTKVNDPKDLEKALEDATVESSNVIIEEYIDGREITASVLEGQALPLVEIIPHNELYDYEAKYIKGKSDYIAPAKLDDKTTKAIQEAAVKIYDLIGCYGLARVDFILHDGKYYFLELNSLPGMTELSLAPMAAQAAGIEFDDLIKKLIDSALEH